MSEQPIEERPSAGGSVTPEPPAAKPGAASSAPGAPAQPDPSGGARTVKEKTADKPHPITIRLGLLGILSPAIALVALFVSFEALRTNERSMEIGQRAYVSLQDGKITFSHLTIGPPPAPSSGVQPPGAAINNEQGPIATMLLATRIVNTGNTPAEFTTFTPSFRHLPEGWTVRQQPNWQPVEKVPPYLDAKSQTVWQYHQTFALTPAAWSAYFDPGRRTGLYVSGELRYTDVFQKEHNVDWCWMTYADERNQGYVTDCNAMTFEQTSH